MARNEPITTELSAAVKLLDRLEDVADGGPTLVLVNTRLPRSSHFSATLCIGIDRYKRILLWSRTRRCARTLSSCRW
jgi:hypothetical protein